MTDRPKVSVVIPAYNAGACVGRAVESVLAQTYRDFDLIVVDDGSTDDTARVLAGYRPALRVLQQRNRGMSAARNAGIRAAGGTYVTFLDADDWWLPEKLELQVDLMERSPAVGFCSGAARVVSPQGEVLNLWSCPQRTGRVLELLFAEHGAIAGGASAGMVRRSLLERAGLFDEDLRGFEDPDLWLRLAAVSDYACIARPLAVIVRREGSASQNRAMMREGTLKSLRKNRRLLSRDRQGAFWRGSLGRAYVHHARWAWRAGDGGAALADAVRALAVAPLGCGRLCLGLLKDCVLGRPL